MPEKYPLGVAVILLPTPFKIFSACRRCPQRHNSDIRPLSVGHDPHTTYGAYYVGYKVGCVNLLCCHAGGLREKVQAIYLIVGMVMGFIWERVRVDDYPCGQFVRVYEEIACSKILQKHNPQQYRKKLSLVHRLAIFSQTALTFR